MERDITMNDLASFRTELEDTPSAKVIARAVQKNGVNAASENYVAKRNLNRVFSLDLETGKVTNQKRSGRCWLFATLNTLRHEFAKKYNVKDFQFSQNYNSFYDRLEKANKFYETVIETAELPFTERHVEYLFAGPDSDGGQWANAAALIAKYGVVPQAVMPETYNSENTNEFSETLTLKLRKDGLALRKLISKGATEIEVNKVKKEYLNQVYRMLVYVFGEPPVEFDFEYQDDKKDYHLDRNLTPQKFYGKYVARQWSDYVCLTNAPDHELDQLYGLDSQDYIFNGQKIALVNTDIQALKKAAIAQMKDGETVWFGNDVLKDMDRKQGILDTEFYKKDDLFSIDLKLSKADRLRTHEGSVSHAMTLTGVDIVDGNSTKWKVENSWGEKNGAKGYFIMSDAWFDDYVYEVIVNKRYLGSEQEKILTKEKIMLEPWDSLA
ncbi:aminopeptidase C [Liquorilactobacillus sucicola DSM 21376 = JCM 15457]|uniref:Aminopeptidase n=1 Tax=Liquorilactobacillus sucicola DSM 21376 = JCM 15457 TaxID=1423806 RepID=A0A023CYY3_9LACO|nr:C1 family peptidase [Liquorilactobacillus sucicola]KRN07588.1 hydrolase peptidase C [Liquorilactobacillus sucicola DSM 21376 = JCM 15457]GAJ26781.1 aminopeptidase C [Liquorilactobacillus sucicola DSM 21376 = JCM 15457]